MGVFQIAHGGEGYIDRAVDIVVSLLHFCAQNTDDFEAETVDPDVLAQRVASGKQLLLGFRTDHRDTRALDLILHVVKAALAQFQGTNGIHSRVISAGGEDEVPVVVLHIGLFFDIGRDVRDLGKIGGERVDVILREANLHSGFLAPGLHGSFTRNHDDELSPEIRKDVGAGLAETIAVGEQHDDRGDAPSHAQHGERGSAAIVAHGRIGFP